MRAEKQLEEAQLQLGKFVLCQAHAFKLLLGFGWEASPAAPSDYRSLRRAYLKSSLTGGPLPVSNEHSESTIYAAAGINYAFRFWHDVMHVRHSANFDVDGEILVGNRQLETLHSAGWGPGTLEYDLLYADTLGQTLCGVATGYFPDDQECFARRSVTTSVTDAIKYEVARRYGIDQGSK